MYEFGFVNYEFDSNGDGYPDTYVEEYDTDGDGFSDQFSILSDTDGDGMYDTFTQGKSLDSNGDGIPDQMELLTDTNGDGSFNNMTLLSDTNGDGVMDNMVSAADTNHSGRFDTFEMQVDSNGDGQVDFVQKAHDYNQDGEIDSVTTYTDTDHDGAFDTVTKAYDSTGDGQIDKMDLYIDTGSRGGETQHDIYSIDPSTGQLIPASISESEIGGTVYTELDCFQPNDSYPDGISGDPAEAMTFWECQGDTNRCALFAQKFVIEELSPEGTKIDIEEFAEIAKQNGWFTESGGTSLLNMNNMLNYYGVENEMSFHNSIGDIEKCLNDGGKVIVSIDSHEIWYGEDNNIFAPESASNHAVEVIGVDRTDPEHPMVILNDSGTPNGRGEMIPLEVFEGAWEDGDCQMIECYPSR